VKTEQYASAETDALIAAATLVPDAILPELPRLRIEDMNNLLPFEDDEANDDIQDNDVHNYPGVLKNEPTLEESLFLEQEEQDDNNEARIAIQPAAPPVLERIDDGEIDSIADAFEVLATDGDDVSTTSEGDEMKMAIDTDRYSIQSIGEQWQSHLMF
jgi:hypothetical protein